MESKILLVGPGNMGREYMKVLQHMNIEPIVIGRGEESALRFRNVYGVKVMTGDFSENLKNLKEIPQYAINSSSIEALVDTTTLLLETGVKNILVEKPAGIHEHELRKISELAKAKDANVYVAYNRRFYSSTQKALDIILEDGGVTSFSFEFTEWGNRIAESVSRRTTEYKEAWFLLNSTHVVDLAFFLGGEPIEMSSYVKGELDWHKSGCIYAGAGISDRGALFSYQANWDAPGRWAVEIMTKKHRLYLKPMEELYVQELNSVVVSKLELEDSLDKEFKPGLYRQVECFLSDKTESHLLSIDKQLQRFTYYNLIEKKH